ncbi:hypothetical protein QYE76_040418 [Lolium multiflorum]|uniref:Reverse transcriptase domain-containing protein n=1 Tax=Lolium multiflorum TaxID=4521 RepID=A0AAD8TBP1_LOLMU|nr:hypothetical protein QYE76_040418 [Lolium multiflorum]
MMQKCLATQIGKTVQVYIDDVVITTKKGSTLIEDLKETFDNLDKFRLKLNPTKCSFGVPAGELLGFLVSARGIEANPEKTQAIQAGEIDNLTVKLGQSILIVLCRFHVDVGIPGVAPHYTPSPTTFTWPSSPTGLNFPSRNLLDSAAGGTFMSITLGAVTKLLDNMMINYSEWHTERTPQGKKLNSVEETSSLSDKIDVIMSMLVNGRSNVDPNNVPLASLVAQEEHVDVNFTKNNNFNNNAYRNNFGNNYRPYPSNNGNGYGNSYNNNRSVTSGLEAILKEFISTQTAFNKSVEEKLGKIDDLASKVNSLAADVDLLKLKVMPSETKDIKSFATANAIQVESVAAATCWASISPRPPPAEPLSPPRPQGRPLNNLSQASRVGGRGELRLKIESLGSPQPTDEETNPYHDSKYKNHPSEAY